MILWMKFPDEIVADRVFADGDRVALESVFDTTNPKSSWNQAIRVLKLSAPKTPMIAWQANTPYINWTAFLGALTGGIMRPIRMDDGSYALQAHYTFAGIWRMMAAQWSLSRFMHLPLPETPTIAESIALGLVLQSLMIRLGSYGADMPRYLADPKNAPASCRKILRDLQTVQMRRTLISPVWNEVLPASTGTPAQGPEYFWDDMTSGPSPAPQDAGQSVCAGIVTGIAVAVSKETNAESIAALKAKHNAPVILIFRYARPETTLLFPYADGLIFCEGGVLSHACTVARDMNIPAITNMGVDFMQNNGIWLTLDGAQGTAIKV